MRSGRTWSRLVIARQSSKWNSAGRIKRKSVDAAVANPWDHKQGYAHKRGKQESAKAYKAFTCYLELGDKRSLERVEKILGFGRNHLNDFQHKYAWTSYCQIT